MTLPTKPRLGLTAWLALLVVGAILPLLLFAGLTLRGVFRTSRALADRGQVDTARALALAVDGEVHAWRAGLFTLASSLSLQRGRWAEFYEEAREVATRYEGWVVLNPATGPQRLNTLRPFGAPLPQTAAPDMVQAVFREGKPMTDMAFGAVAQRYVISNTIPVFRDGKVVFCLSLNFGPERLTRLLQKQQFPETWVAAINDSQRRVVGRSREAESRVGKPVVEWFAAATRAAESGIVTGPLIDGRLGQIAFQRLTEVPWVVSLAVPVEELQSAAPIWGFLSLGVILGFVAVGIAVYTGRKVLVPVTHLARMSGRLLRGETGDSGPPSTIREVQELQQALIEASAAARAHIEEREQNAQALEQANEVLEARVADRTAALAHAIDALQAVNADLLQEIAQRKRAEEEIQALARFPSENPHPVLRLDSEGRILFANAASTTLLRQWGSTVGRQAPAPWPETIRDALTNQLAKTTELICGDRTYAVFVAPVPDAGYVNLYMSDITERKRAEEAAEEARAHAVNERNRLEAVMRTLPVGVALVDAHGGNIDANIAYEQVWGGPRPAARTVADYAAYRAWWPDTGQPVRPEEWASAQAVQLKRPAVGQLLQIERFDGTRAFVLNSAAPILDAEGEVVGAAVAIQNITALKEAEERLTVSLREKEVLLKEVHHRVKNNLQVIASLVSLQADGLDDPRLRDLFRDVHDRVRSMALVHEKLYQSESLARVDFGDYVRSLLSHLGRAHATSAARIQLRLDLEPVPLSVEVAVPCGLILNELAGNALKHAFAGRAAGDVTVTLHTEPDGRVRLSVSDNGVGLPEGLDWRQARSLGLRLVQMLAAQINGAVEMQSGAGTEFAITFTPPGAPGDATERRHEAGEGRP